MVMTLSFTTEDAEVNFQNTFKWEHKFVLGLLTRNLNKKNTQLCQNIFNLESETKNFLGTSCVNLILKC